MKIIKRTIVLACAVSSFSQAANMLLNGSFETPVNGSDFVVYSAATTPAGFGWTIFSGSIDIDRSNLIGTAIVARDGNQWIDLNGLTIGSILQDIATTPGGTYLLRFSYADNPFNSTTGQTKTGTAFVVDTIGSQVLASLGLSHNTTTGGNANWIDTSILFTASSATTRIQFVGGQFGSNGIYLDAVSLDVAAPEPSTWMFMALVLAACALRRQLKRGVPHQENVARDRTELHRDMPIL